jgi:hypothetical protein
VVDFVAVVAFYSLEVVVLEGAIDYIFVIGLLYLSGILLGFNFGLGFGVSGFGWMREKYTKPYRKENLIYYICLSI